MYAMSKSSWSVGDVIKLLRKTEGKGNMKVVYVLSSVVDMRAVGMRACIPTWVYNM